MRGGARLRRMRDVMTPASFGGADCGHMKEYKEYTKDASLCTSGSYYGQWSQCTKDCGSGTQYRYKERVVCSTTAVVKYIMKFRMGRRCNVQDCDGTNSTDTVRSVIVPPVSTELVPTAYFNATNSSFESASPQPGSGEYFHQVGSSV